MKTAIIFDEVQAELQFYVVDGDWTKFDDVYINSTEEVIANEFYDRFYDAETGLIKHDSVPKYKFIQAIKDGANVICCGFMP